MIALIAYCEREGLDDVAAPLTEAMERIAPRLRPAQPAPPPLRLAHRAVPLAAE